MSFTTNVIIYWSLLSTLVIIARAGRYCMGTAQSCCIQGPPFDDKETCEKNGFTGCYWDPAPGQCSCQGTPKACDSFDESTCEQQEGCYTLSDYKCQIVFPSTETFCWKMFFPQPGYFTMYRHCPMTSNPNHLECSFCNIYQAYDIYEDNFDFDTTLKCDRCTLCSNRVSWDCSNLVGGDCSVTNCAGECIAGEEENEECTRGFFNLFCK